MNQMDEINKLYAKSKTYKIPLKPKEGQEQASIQVTPLALDESEVMDMGKDLSPNESTKRITAFIATSLNITKEEAGKIAYPFLEDILAAIMDVNDFQKEDMKKTGIEDFIKKKRAQIKEQQEREKNESKSDRAA